MKAQYKQITIFLRLNLKWCLIALLVAAELFFFSWLNVPADNHYEQYLAQTRPTYPSDFWFILIENIKSCLLMVAHGFLPLGIGVFFSMYLTAGSLVAAIKRLLMVYNAGTLFTCLAPHAIFELTGLLLCMIFSALLSVETTVFITRLFKKPRNYFNRVWTIAKGMAFVCIPLLVLAAVMEVSLSSLLVKTLLQ